MSLALMNIVKVSHRSQSSGVWSCLHQGNKWVIHPTLETKPFNGIRSYLRSLEAFRKSLVRIKHKNYCMMLFLKGMDNVMNAYNGGLPRAEGYSGVRPSLHRNSFMNGHLLCMERFRAYIRTLLDRDISRHK
jgi:hypothetical protein